MKYNPVIQELHNEQMKKNIPTFRVGDVLNVHTRLIEGEKERIQIFTGTVIARKGCGIAETFSLYRVSYGAGMERVFLLHSPIVAKIEVVRTGKVRKAKLYRLRGASGKAAKIKEHIAGIQHQENNGNASEETPSVEPSA